MWKNGKIKPFLVITAKTDKLVLLMFGYFSFGFCENKNIEKLKDIFEKNLLPKKEDPYQLFLRSLISDKNERSSRNNCRKQYF
jgi:hypothetical protein